MDMDGVHRTPAASGAPRQTAGEGEMKVGAHLQFLKVQGPLDKLKFSLFSGAQMKKSGIPNLHNFSRSTTFVLCKFSFETHILNYFKFSNLHKRALSFI